jgi:hypothetical protein
VNPCRYCGAEIPAGLDGCPACDDAGESLPALELDDDELGYRAEDRYVFLPGTGEGIRRRIHDDSLGGPIAILVGLLLLFLLAAWLGGS